MHYRVSVYNAFAKMFESDGYEFHVASNSYNPNSNEVGFVKHEVDLSFSSCKRLIENVKPDVVIDFLHLSDNILFRLTLLCRMKKIPIIYWNHGIDLLDKKNKIKCLLYRALHSISDAVILYTPNELQYISKKNQAKTFIAYNTLNLEGDSSNESVDKIKEKLKLRKDTTVVLYVSRILPYKGLDVLMSSLKNTHGIELVIVGSPLSPKQNDTVKATSHFHYLGALYGDEVNRIYSIGDVFSTPGHIGLAINQAFYWSLPVVLLKGHHAPEIYYLKDGVNGVLCDNESDLTAAFKALAENRERLEKMKKNARKTYETSMRIQTMYTGFIEAVNHVLQK